VSLDLEALKTLMTNSSPHMRALGLSLLQLGGGVAVGTIPYREELVGDPSSGVLHGGVVTSLLDSVAGAAVFSALDPPEIIATLDLRIDYLRPSTPGQPVSARVECFKLTRHVAFARGIAYNATPDDPVASLSGTFMRRTPAARAVPAGGKT
jgi:uncharacterized protein (TIGR00369 family)